MTIRFDLITIDVVEPRETAAMLTARGDMRLELDEDDGRWLVVASMDGHRRCGLQRSDPREVAARAGGVDDVVDGCLTLTVADPDRVAAFFSSVASLERDGNRLLLNGEAVIDVTAGAASPTNIHLDFECARSEFASEIDRALDLGATRVGPHRSEHWGETQILAAPSGDLFCVNAYQ